MSQDVEKWAASKGYSRPVAALVQMSAEDREEMRATLRFGWPGGAKGDALREAKALINHQLWGVVGRLHRKSESLNWTTPSLTWRGVLTRIAEDRLGKSLGLSAPVEEVEQLLLDELLERPIEDTEPESFTADLPPVHPAVAALPIVEQALDWMLDSKDGPATRVVLAICAHLHPEGPESGA